MKRAANLIRIIFWVSGIVLLWTGSAFFLSGVLSRKPAECTTPTLGDLATVFFGASSLALIIFSLIIAIAAIVEWQSLKRDVSAIIAEANASRERIDRVTKENEERVANLEQAMTSRLQTLEQSGRQGIARVEKEMLGRVNTIMGLAIGTVHSDPLARRQQEEKRDYLAEAVYFCQKGFDTLRELEGDGKYMALNNLLYYSCLLELPKRDLLLKQGGQLLEVAEKYEGSRYVAPYFLTFCRVMATYESDRARLQEALSIAEGLLEKGLTSLQKKEARLYVALLQEKLEPIAAKEADANSSAD